MPFGVAQSVWSNALQSYSNGSIELCGTVGVQLLFFYVPVLAFSALSAFAPKFAYRHQLQPREKPPSREDVLKCFRVVAANQAMATALHVTLLWAAPRGSDYRFDEKLPSLSEVARDIFACVLMREVAFYYSHRILHSRLFYARIHKLHHQFTAPFALAAQYAHPIEHLVANVIPISLPPRIMHSHIIVFWLFLAIELMETAIVHSGFDFLHRAAKSHDLHHQKFAGNFGTIGLLDWMHGTRL
ncbi:hypothetical protein FRC08_000557 [Ceratobasidium sp. 394]|nr:hypothetical protein FRC08_000557 [Ceratobasidium sp. 394]